MRPGIFGSMNPVSRWSFWPFLSQMLGIRLANQSIGVGTAIVHIENEIET